MTDDEKIARLIENLQRIVRSANKMFLVDAQKLADFRTAMENRRKRLGKP